MTLIFTALGWLTGSKIGRYAAIGMILAAMAAYMLYAARRGGIKAEQAKQVAASLDNLRRRIKTDDEIRSLSPDERTQRLREWAEG